MGAVVDRSWLTGIMAEYLDPICVGIDIGKITDPTAICVSEVKQRHTGKYRYNEPPTPAFFDENWRQILAAPKDADPVMLTEYFIRHIQRLPLGMSYPNQAIHIAEMLCKPVFAHRQVRVLMDRTGVGMAVYDDLRREISLREEARSIHLKPINFVHGERYNLTTGALGKAYLVSRLQSLLQGKRVHAPDTAEVNATIEELKVYQINVDTDGTDTYGASTGKHDDLVTAMALSALEDPYGDRVTYSKRVY